MFISELFLNEISDDLRRNYLDRAGKHVDRRLERIAAVRDRLNKGYEIYHADRPTNGNAIVDHFEADTPALARQYYEKFIRDYVSDVDFDLRLRRATGIMEYREPKVKKAHRDGIDLEAWRGGLEFQIDATAHGRDLGRVVFDIQYQGDQPILVAKDLMILPDYRGQGIAAIMYDYAKELGYHVERSREQTDAGKHFWDKNRGEEGQLWEDPVNEITMVNTQSRSKRQHTDVLPNDGKPIPPGEEAEHLGELTTEMPGGYQLWSWTDRGTTTYYVFDPHTRTSQLGTSGRAYPENRNSFVIMGTYSGPNNQVRAADLYAFLIFDRGLTLVSDNKQSTGGYRVWQELEKRYGRKLNIHGFDTKTNEPVNVTTQDEPDTHVSRADVKKAGPQMKKELGSISRDLRFVASAK